MTDQARAARRAYKRKWAKAHPDKVKLYQLRYWENRARKEAKSQEGSEPVADE